MARYTNFLTVPSSVSSLRASIASTLKSCGLNMIYEQEDYLVAKEKPGAVTFSQLATIEVLITPPSSSIEEAKINLVVRNEELPLHQDNHCQRVFEEVNQALVTVV
jgi:hypothetical protein